MGSLTHWPSHHDANYHGIQAPTSNTQQRYRILLALRNTIMMQAIIALSFATMAAAHIAPRQTTCAATAAIPTCGVCVSIPFRPSGFPCQWSERCKLTMGLT